MKLNFLGSRLKKYLPLFLVGCLLFLGVADHVYYNQRLYPGVQVKGVPLGNSTLSQAEEKMRDLEMKFTGLEGKEVSIPLNALGIKPQYGEILEQGYQKGRRASWPFCYVERWRLRNGVNLSFPYTVNEARLNRSMEQLEKTFESEPQAAYFEIVDGESKLFPEKPGYQLQREKLWQKIISHLDQDEEVLELGLPLEEVPPDGFTVHELEQKGIAEPMASYTTSFDASNEDRAHNIALAAREMDHYLIPPGTVFSFNGVIGNTTPQKGYREAPIIRGGDYTTGYGGGICQVSSTLYNAALLSNLKIVERHHHRFRAHYIEGGRDATVYYGVYDLKFVNDRDHHLLINAGVENGELTVSVIGRPLKEEVKIITRETKYVEPPQKVEETYDLPEGEENIIEGIPGGTVEAWRKVHYPISESKKEKLSTDNYQPYPTKIRRGKKEN